MSFESLPGFPTLRDQFVAQKVLVAGQRTHLPLVEHFYFTYASPDLRGKAQSLAERMGQISRGRRTRIMTENSDLIGKLGEFTVRSFLQDYLSSSQVKWQDFVENINPRGGDRCDFLAAGLQLDVKTRQLYEDELISPLFSLCVPHTDVEKYQDLYILAGYCPNTSYGYVLGWCTWNELQSRPVNTDLKFAAKCVPLLDLHPMQLLRDYLEQKGRP